MGKKLALLIGNDVYDDPGFSRLVVPSADIQGLQEVLSDPDIGAFDSTTPLHNQPSRVVAEAMESFMQQGRPDDLLLIYFSGHGLRSATDGRLYLALKDTRRERLRATGISASFVSDIMDDSACRRNVLILDCCYSGAFSTGFKGAPPVGESVDTRGAFAGRGFGRVILSASDETQYAWEGENVVGQGQTSLYTQHLIQGLKSGSADRDQDGQITINELHDYAYEEVRRISSRQTPQIHVSKAEGQIVIASVPQRLRRAVVLPPHVREALASPFTEVRLGVIGTLEQLLKGPHTGLALAAKDALSSLLEDDSRRVAAAAAAAVGETAVRPLVRSGSEIAVVAPSASRENSTENREEVMLHGAERLTAALKATLGPHARRVVILRKEGEPLTTTNSRVIVRDSELKNPLEQLGAQLIRSVVLKTSQIARDGSATAAILACEITRAALKYPPGAERIAVTRGIEKAAGIVIRELGAVRADLTAQRVAQVSATTVGGDAGVGELIAEAMKLVGRDGVITIQESGATATRLDTVEGMRLEEGYLSPYFATDAERMEAVLDDPYILLDRRVLTDMKAMLPVLEQVARSGKPLLVVAAGVEGEALTTLVVNKLRATLNVCAVKAPGSGDRQLAMLEDLAVMTGAEIITGQFKPDSVTLDLLGRANRVIVDQAATTLVDCGGNIKTIENRIRQVRSQIDQASETTRPELMERLAKLAAGVAVIRVGATTEAAMNQRKVVFEEALHITRAAVQEGVVAGGGVALLRAGRALERQCASPSSDMIAADLPGAKILAHACQLPFREIALSAGEDPDSAVTRALANSNRNYGLNAATREWGDLLETGIIDPLKTVRFALQTAVAESVSFLNSELAIFES